jgi:hypothetical protein
MRTVLRILLLFISGSFCCITFGQVSAIGGSLSFQRSHDGVNLLNNQHLRSLVTEPERAHQIEKKANLPELNSLRDLIESPRLQEFEITGDWIKSRISRGGESGGGDEIRLKILEIANQIFSELEHTSNGRQLLEIFNVSLSRLQEYAKIENMLVVPEVLIDRTGSDVSAIVKEGKLILNFDRWDRTLFVTKIDVNVLVFHELLRLSSYMDDEYFISKHLRGNQDHSVVLSRAGGRLKGLYHEEGRSQDSCWYDVRYSEGQQKYIISYISNPVTREACANQENRTTYAYLSMKIDGNNLILEPDSIIALEGEKLKLAPAPASITYLPPLVFSENLVFGPLTLSDRNECLKLSMTSSELNKISQRSQFFIKAWNERFNDLWSHRCLRWAPEGFQCEVVSIQYSASPIARSECDLTGKIQYKFIPR